jgi:hypothetical protein
VANVCNNINYTIVYCVAYVTVTLFNLNVKTNIVYKIRDILSFSILGNFCPCVCMSVCLSVCLSGYIRFYISQRLLSKLGGNSIWSWHVSWDIYCCARNARVNRARMYAFVYHWTEYLQIGLEHTTNHHKLHGLRTLHVHVPHACVCLRVVTALACVRSLILDGFSPSLVGSCYGSLQVTWATCCGCWRTARVREPCARTCVHSFTLGRILSTHGGSILQIIRSYITVRIRHRTFSHPAEVFRGYWHPSEVYNIRLSIPASIGRF